MPEKEEIELLTEILEYPNLYSCIQLLSNTLALLKYNHDPKEHHFYFFLKALKDYQSIYIQYYPRLVNSILYILLKYFSEQDKINEKVLSRILEVLDQSFETQRIGKKNDSNFMIFDMNSIVIPFDRKEYFRALFTNDFIRSDGEFARLQKEVISIMYSK